MRGLIPVVAVALLAAGCASDRASPAASGSGTTLTVTSTAFAAGQPIPGHFTCRGAGASPPLAWTGVPGGTTSVALVVTDPDAGDFLHWVLYDLPPGDGSIAEDQPPAGTRAAVNGSGQEGWTPPCPPAGTHHYHFTVYALPTRPVRQTGREIVRQLDRIAIARGELVGLVSATP
jgi:Raf kinase inhibitor-like YbhB/YbcL family protein